MLLFSLSIVVQGSADPTWAGQSVIMPSDFPSMHATAWRVEQPRTPQVILPINQMLTDVQTSRTCCPIPRQHPTRICTHKNVYPQPTDNNPTLHIRCVCVIIHSPGVLRCCWSHSTRGTRTYIPLARYLSTQSTVSIESLAATSYQGIAQEAPTLCE